MKPREPNAPEPLPDAEDASRAVDRLSESDEHRRRTARGVDVEALQREIEVAHESKRNRARARRRELYVLLGATAGYLGLAYEIWRALRWASNTI